MCWGKWEGGSPLYYFVPVCTGNTASVVIASMLSLLWRSRGMDFPDATIVIAPEQD
jgi:hypothetical protein